MKSLRTHFTSPVPHEASANSADNLTGEFRRSYNAMNAVLMSIFELIYLPEQVLEQRDAAGRLLNQEKSHQLLDQMKEQYHVFGDYDGKGLLALRIVPVVPGTKLRDISPESKNIRNAITTFYSEINEYGAGISGVEIDPIHHNLLISNPRGYLSLIETICQERGIATSEQAHTAYALRNGDPDAEVEGGHYEHPGIPALPKKQGAESWQVLPKIPEPVFLSLTTQPLGYQEIGQLVMDYREKAVYPLLSLSALEAAVEQDLQRTPVLAKLPAFNLH
jgi:hypothetical protein